MLATVVPPPHRRQRRHPALHDARGRSTVMGFRFRGFTGFGSCRLKGPMRLHLSRQCRNPLSRLSLPSLFVGKFL